MTYFQEIYMDTDNSQSSYFYLIRQTSEMFVF